VPAEDLAPSMRLDQDLALDSLALTEVVVLLIVDFDMETLAEELEQRDWRGVTLGDLYGEYRTGQPARRG
jgi:acyl carrier protein